MTTKTYTIEVGGHTVTTRTAGGFAVVALRAEPFTTAPEPRHPEGFTYPAFIAVEKRTGAYAEAARIVRRKREARLGTGVTYHLIKLETGEEL